jgi:uncharacterized membrane protein
MVTIDEGRRGGLGSPGLVSQEWDSLYISLIPLPAAFMLATLVSDLLYWGTGGAFWSEVSEWLLGAGLATGALAAADGLIQYLASGRIRPSRICWMHVVGNMLALLLSLSNLVYRLNEDRGHAVLPAGISLTAIVLCLLLFTARLGRDIARNDPAADLDDPDLIWEDAAPPPRAFNVPDAAPARPVVVPDAAPAPPVAAPDSTPSRPVVATDAAPLPVPPRRRRSSGTGSRKRGLEQVPKAPPAQGDPRSAHERGPVATPRKDRAARRRLEEVDPVE